MLLSIRRIFSNLKIALLLLAAGMAILSLQLFHLAQYGDRLTALKNQHLQIEKVISTDTNDLQMASILVNGALLELELSVKLSGEETFIDSIVASNGEQESLLRSLSLSSTNFRDSALVWIQSLPIHRDSMQERMSVARLAYLRDIDRMVDYQIHVMNQSLATAKMSALFILIFGIITYFLYRYRLIQIYRDIDRACALDIEGTKIEIFTKEIDFILKRLARKSCQSNINPSLLHPLSGLNNEKGMLYSFNAKKAGKAGNTLFLALFEIDNIETLTQTLSAEDIGNMYKKLGEMLSMFEQPLDVIAHLDSNHLVFILSRNSKDVALSECDHFVEIVSQSSFNTTDGAIKITLSAGFLLKAPIKSLDESIADARKLIEKAKETGGNRVAQLRDRTPSTR